MNKVSLKTTLDKNFSDAITMVQEKLKENGFGTLTDVDLKEKFKEKLEVEYTNYRILGACNPEFAHKVLNINKSVGLFLPCTVLVYEDEGRVFVEIQKPTFISQVFENSKIKEIAKEVEKQLEKAIAEIK
jgi:uncharacterized protein (DUF302 family)